MMQGKAENSMSRHDGIIVKNIINQSESDLFFAKRCKKYYTGMMMAIYYVVLCFIGFSYCIITGFISEGFMIIIMILACQAIG